jgi:hypothetical protein
LVPALPDQELEKGGLKMAGKSYLKSTLTILIVLTFSTAARANSPDNCIIDCQGAPSIKRRGFYLHSGETHASVIDGFTIINGTGRDEEYTGVCGGAIFVYNN